MDNYLAKYAERAQAEMWKALVQPFHNAIVVQAIQQGEELSDWAEQVVRIGPMVFRAYPGMGKTHMVTWMAEALGTQLPTLFLGLTHESFDNVPTNIEWSHWKPHNSDCKAHRLATKGFNPTRQCDCDADRSRPNEGPTFATVEHVLTDAPDGQPLTVETLGFPLWVFDEIGMDKFIDTMVVTQPDLNLTSEMHPSSTVKMLALALRQVLAEHERLNADKTRYHAENWRGAEFYQHLDSALAKLGMSVSGLYETLPLPGSELNDDWTQGREPDTLPPNFTARFLDILAREWGSYLNSRTYNPCIHVVKDSTEKYQPVQSMIRIRKRKFVPNFWPSVVLDATANAGLIEKVFGPLQGIHLAKPPDFPPAVRVRQVRDHILSKTWLTDAGKLRKNYRELLQQEIGRYQKQLGLIQVGLLTFEDLEKDCKDALVEIGVPESNVITGHFWNQKGKNKFFDRVPCDVFVIMGYPRPNPEILYEEACALFNDEETPISREWTRHDEHLILHNEWVLTVKDIDGYEDERLQSLYNQKARLEFYQAFHRARPYLEEGIKEILVFTNIPIPYGVVTGFIGVDGEMFDALETLAQGQREARVNDMADLIFERRHQMPSATERESLITRIRRNKDWLCQATGAVFMGGTSKSNPSRFRPAGNS